MTTVAEELTGQIQDAWRFRTIGIVVAWVIALVGWVTVLAIPSVYEAEARVYVDTSTALRPLLQGIAVDQDIDAQLNQVREILLGRPQLERVAREADRDLMIKADQDRDEMLRKLQKKISIEAASPGQQDHRRSSDSVYTI